MNFVKLLSYDLKKGLLRKKYLTILPFFLLPCVVVLRISMIEAAVPSWGDYIMECFKGQEYAETLNIDSKFALPIIWLLPIAWFLFLNLDYLPGDLSHLGQQTIIRSGNRKHWFIAKCVWNFCTVVMFGVGMLAVTGVFTLFTKGMIVLKNTPVITMTSFGCGMVLFENGVFVMNIIVIPLVVLWLHSMMEMVLCIILKPVWSYLTVVSLLVSSIYIAYLPGSGMMSIRYEEIVENGISHIKVAEEAIVGIIFLGIMGILLFNKADILTEKE